MEDTLYVFVQFFFALPDFAIATPCAYVTGSFFFLASAATVSLSSRRSLLVPTSKSGALL